MAGAGFDARMIGAADGPLKDRFGRLAYVWTGAQERPREAVRGARSRSTARSGSGARRAASWSATWASCSAASRRSRAPSPTTARSSSGSSPPTAPWPGCAPSPAPRSTRPRPRRTRRRRRRGRSGSGSTARCRTSSTAATGRRSSELRIKVSPAPSASRVPGEADLSRGLTARRVWSVGEGRAVLLLAAAAGDGDARRRARRASAPRSSCRTSGRARRARSRRWLRTPAARASRRVMRSASHVCSTVMHAPLARLRAGCGTASRRPGTRGSPGRAPSVDLGHVGGVDVAAEERDRWPAGAPRRAARRGRAAARPWSRTSAGTPASARGRAPRRMPLAERAREAAPGARADRLVPGLEVVDAPAA